MLALRRRASRLWKAARPVLESSVRSLRTRRRRPIERAFSPVEPLEQRQMLSGISIDYVPCISVDEGTSFDLRVDFSDSDGGSDYWACVTWGDGSCDSPVSGQSDGGGLYVCLSHTYDAPPTGSPCITICEAGDSTGTSASFSACVNDLTASVSIDGPGSVSLDDPSTPSWSFSASHSAGDQIVEWTIYWGDGNSESFWGYGSTLSGLCHSYTNSYYSEYQITAFAVDDDGQSSYSATCICITNEPPTLCISGDSSCAEGDSYTLVLEAYDPGNTSVSGTVNWGDGSSDSFGSGMSSLSHGYSGEGYYCVSVSAADAYGASNSAERYVEVYNVAPCIQVNSAAASVPEGYTYTLQLEFDDAANDTVNWTIDWGDGTPATTGTARSASARHIFKAREGGSVCVTVNADDGCTSICESWCVDVCASVGTHFQVQWDGLVYSGPHAALCSEAANPLDLKSPYDADSNNVSDDYLNFGTPLQTLQQAIGGAVSVSPGGPWGGSSYYYAFPGTSGYHVCLHYDFENSYRPDKPADYLATIDLWVAGQWREKTWQARLSPIDSTPAAPAGFTATYVSATQIDLSWTDQSPIESQYLIEQSANGGQSWTALPPRPANSTSYSATGPFNPATSYQFRLRAADAFGRSSAPVTCSVATPPLPAAPSELELLSFTAEGIYLYWTDNSDDETGFVVEWTDGVTTQSTTADANVSDCYIPGPFAASTTYAFRVAAQNASGRSAFISQSLASPAAPADPSSLVFISISSTTLSLSLADNSSSEEGFLVEASADAGVTWEYLGSAPASEGTGTISISIGGVFAPGTARQFRVRAYNDFIESGPTSTVSATTAGYPLACTNLSMASATPGSISLVWSNPGNQTALVLHRSEDYEFAAYDTIALNPADTSLTDANLDPGTLYYYRLIASNAAGDSAPAHLDAGTLLADPAAPTATAISAWRIDLDWADAGSALDYYEIHRSTEDDFAPSSETLAGTAYTSDWTDYGLAPAGTYYYRVVAVDVFERFTLASPDTAAGTLAAPTASAPASVAEDSSFALTLAAGPNTLSGWTVWWGDGQVEELASGSGSLTHSYLGQSRTVSVYARAYDEDGAHDLPAVEIELTNLAPTAGISGDSAGTEGGVFVLNLSASDSGCDPIASWQINWGDGQTQTIYGSPGSINHIYADDGQYSIAATATDIDGGTSSSVSHIVTIADAPATFSFASAGPIAADGSYTLYITHADPGSDPVTSYSINWGDGTAAETISLSPDSGPTTRADHTYANPACSYTVAVTASGQSAGSVSTSATPRAEEECFIIYLQYPASDPDDLSIKEQYDPETFPADGSIPPRSWARQYVLAGDERAAVMEALDAGGLSMQLSAMEWMEYPNNCYRGSVTVEGSTDTWVVCAYPEFLSFNTGNGVADEDSSTWFEVMRTWTYADDPQTQEQEPETQELAVTLRLGGPAEHGGSKDYRLKDLEGNVVAVSDGQATVTIPAGSDRVRVYVEPVNDSVPEWTEEVLVTFAAAQPFRTEAGAERKRVYIRDNDVDIILQEGILEANYDDDDENGTPDYRDLTTPASENDFYRMELKFPPAKPGAQVVLTAPPDKVRVWTEQAGGRMLIGGEYWSYQWFCGQEDPPQVVWLEVIHGSAQENDIVLTLVADEFDASVEEPTLSSTEEARTAVGVKLMWTDPTLGVQWDAGAHVPRILVGQVVVPQIIVESPDAPGMTRWNMPPGPVFERWEATNQFAQRVELQEENLAQQSLRFAWSGSASGELSAQVAVSGLHITRATSVTAVVPTNTLQLSHIGSVQIQSALVRKVVQRWDMGLFGSGFTYGIVLDAMVDDCGLNGEFAILQITAMKSLKRVGDFLTGTQYKSRANGHVGLDTVWPYGFLPGLTDSTKVACGMVAQTGDAPDSWSYVKVGTNELEASWMSRDDRFWTYLMYRPRSENGLSEWVPLKRIEWWWRAESELRQTPPPVGPIFMVKGGSDQWGCGGAVDVIIHPEWQINIGDLKDEFVVIP